MGYVSRYGKRPTEYASKSAHSHVVNDASVQEFLKQCSLPKRAEDITFSGNLNLHYEPLPDNPIQHVIAVDGGYQEIAVQTEFPSATLAFFQIGALFFSINDLEGIDRKSFIDPDDMAKLKNIQRLKFSLPVRNITRKTERTLTDSVRRTIYDFFLRKTDDGALMDTLRWFIFREYGTRVPEWMLASCPACERTNTPLALARMSANYTFACTHCNGEILLTDVFRLHEVIDDDLGAGGVLGYVSTTIEQIVLIHLIRIILKTKPLLMNEMLFIKDGPLAFFGQTANMHKPMRELVKFLFEHHNLYLAGLEKSGTFVEHADEIARRLDGGTILLLDNDYIYKYIIPGKADPNNPYGRTTYYSNKLIFKTPSGGMHVVSLPTTDVTPNPTPDDFRNLQAILTNIEKLKCDMYDNALVPVALANKLVSLANHPSSRILQKFALGTAFH
jgi:hypothetical protein